MPLQRLLRPLSLVRFGAVAFKLRRQGVEKAGSASGRTCFICGGIDSPNSQDKEHVHFKSNVITIAQL